MLSLNVILYALLGGILPAFVWLYFILKEDARCPEPRTLIMLAFFAGMLAVPIVLPLEHLARSLLPTIHALTPLFDRFALDASIELPVVLAWAVIEEGVKFGLAALLILWRRQVDEPTDIIIYMICVALGFAAVENALFLLAPIADGVFTDLLVSNNLRFIGATLLHVIASSTIGYTLALAFRKPLPIQVLAGAIGLILAIALHAIFNFLIIKETASHTLLAFFLVWSGAVVGFGLFETLRYARYKRLPTNTC
ncbi:MAG TPA: PrsW family glutamic-type intramembrane protease [Candidatus Paceibacterota bacterium]|nr:PrsW family glutamic-type intramembrane protease [Candidatus Paceibacterota bacterium]